MISGLISNYIWFLIMNNQNKNGNGNGHQQSLPKFSKKFLFVSFESLSGDLAWQLQKEGNEVKVYIKDEDDKEVYDGFLKKVTSWEEHVEWADVIIFDDVGFGKKADSLRNAGKLVIGGSEYTDKLEEDRQFGQEEMKNAGMIVLPHWNFTDFDSAISFIESNPGRYVFKPSGTISSDDKGILFLGQEEDGKDIIEVLEQNKVLWAKKINKFQLQKMAIGVEIAVGAFFNGDDFAYPININFEHKRLFPGDIGPYTGEMGTLMFWSPPNDIFKTTLLKLKDKLKNSGYQGYIDINCIANPKGVYPLEITSRFGYPTISIQMEGIITPWGEFLYTLARKENSELKVSRGFQIGVVVAVPPFPFYDEKEAFIYKDLSILFKKNSREGVHIGDLKSINGIWSVAGKTGYVMVITGSGSTVEEARKMVYSRLKNISLQNMYYRTDIGMRWFVESDKLHTWGYLH